jgi:hypothetical protein
MFDHFHIPFFVADFLDTFLRLPQLNTMRHFGLKCLQVLAGIFRAFPAKLHTLCRCTLCHCALALTVKAAFSRPAPAALQFLKGPLETPGHHHEPYWIFPRPDEYIARGTKQPANRGKTFVRDLDVNDLFI